MLYRCRDFSRTRMCRVTIVMLCLVQSSECQLTNVTTSSIADAVRVSASFVSRFLDAKSIPFLPAALAKYLEKSKDSKSESFIPLLLRVFGINSKTIQEWTLRGFVSLLPLMNQVLTEKKDQRRKRRSPEGFSIFRFVLQRPQVANLLTQMQNPDLVDQLLRESEERLANADCVRLLLCKTKPIVRGMQKSLQFFLNLEKIKTCDLECSRVEDAWKRASLEDRMYFFLPSLSEMVTFGDECDEQYPNCGY